MNEAIEVTKGYSIHSGINLNRFVIPGVTQPAPYLIRGNPLPTGRQECFNGFPLEFTPYLIRGGNDFFRGSQKL